MLCHTVHNVYKNCLQDGVGTSPGATINSWKKKKNVENNNFTWILFIVLWIRIKLGPYSNTDPDPHNKK